MKSMSRDDVSWLAIASWSEVGSFVYSRPQCRATITTSAPASRARAAIRLIAATFRSGTDHGCSDGSGMPFVPYVAETMATSTPATSSTSGRLDSRRVADVPACAMPTASK